MPTTEIDDASVKACRDAAAFFRERGFNPLPSRMDEKRPLCKFAEYWERPFPASEFERWRTGNLQVMTGRRWGLLVIDLDGPESVARWSSMGAAPRTWISHSGGGGMHVWFSVPTDVTPLPKAVLWRGDGKHEAIERLCDKSLVVAPPTVHPRTGRRYQWLDRRHSPFGLMRPAPCPEWVLRLAPVAPPAPLVAERTPCVARQTDHRPARASAPCGSVADVIERIPDLPGLVRSWGVRTVGSPRSSGWISCHAIDRDDSNPSAAIHSRSGYYVDSGSGERMGLIDLSVRLGVFPTRRDAISHLRGVYGSP